MSYAFSPGRAGEHARAFLGDWTGNLVCDDFGGYKASFATGVTEIGYMVHTRRKFFDLHASNKSHIAAQTLVYIQRLYDVERSLKDASAEHRLQRRQELAKPIQDALHNR